MKICLLFKLNMNYLQQVPDIVFSYFCNPVQGMLLKEFFTGKALRITVQQNINTSKPE